MAKSYKVWLEVEEYDDRADKFRDATELVLGIGSVAEFSSKKKASEFLIAIQWLCRTEDADTVTVDDVKRRMLKSLANDLFHAAPSQ